MARKRVTEVLPFLLPLRVLQRKACFYGKMAIDHNRYAKTQRIEQLPFVVCSDSSILINRDTGQDVIYQENKAHNLQLAAKTMQGLMIQPGETFSFWQLVRHAERYGKYKEGLCMTNGKLSTKLGGGMCQLSNLLYGLFLLTPLTVIERHTHRRKDFPSPADCLIEGADATVHEGWLDLKVCNETEDTFQLWLDFDEERIYGAIYCNAEPKFRYELLNRGLAYYCKNGQVYEKVSLYRRRIDCKTGTSQEALLYQNVCMVGYELPEEVMVREE